VFEESLFPTAAFPSEASTLQPKTASTKRFGVSEIVQMPTAAYDGPVSVHAEQLPD
jgi:hypothetical protein